MSTSGNKWQANRPILRLTAVTMSRGLGHGSLPVGLVLDLLITSSRPYRLGWIGGYDPKSLYARYVKNVLFCLYPHRLARPRYSLKGKAQCTVPGFTLLSGGWIRARLDVGSLVWCLSAIQS